MYVLDEEVVTDAQQTAVGVFRGASNAKAICDDANCAWICGVLGKFADAQKADFVKLITTTIKYAPPGYAPPDRKKLDGPLLEGRAVPEDQGEGGRVAQPARGHVRFDLRFRWPL